MALISECSYYLMQVSLSHGLKIINPNNCGGHFVIENFMLPKYASVEELKKKLNELYSTYTDGYEIAFGYIAPGHGMKGKLEVVACDNELAAMYELHKLKKRILLWLKCKPPSTKRSSSDPVDAPPSKRQASLQGMMNEVSTIVDKLTEKHGEKYSHLQLNCWAHLIHIGRHHSYDVAPKKAFFGNTKSDATGVSPGKRLSLRSECIDQLDKWHQLMERGVVSSEEYEELQGKILSDIKKF